MYYDFIVDNTNKRQVSKKEAFLFGSYVEKLLITASKV